MNALGLPAFVELLRRSLPLQLVLVLIHMKMTRVMILEAQTFTDYAQLGWRRGTNCNYKRKYIMIYPLMGPHPLQQGALLAMGSLGFPEEREGE